MAIDLNGSLAGVHNTVTYTEGAASVSIAPAARVGLGSTSANSDRWVEMKLTMQNPQAGDTWSIKSMPAGVLLSLSAGGPVLRLPVDLPIASNATLYLSGTLGAPDNGQEIYETRWYHATGGYTELRYVGDEFDNVDIAAMNGANTRPLDDLVATPLAHA